MKVDEIDHSSRNVVSSAAAAFLALAVGDALGWPWENRAQRVRMREEGAQSEEISQFIPWVRKSGGRFQPFEEPIGAGEYSDDTQLALCSARSLLYGDMWWDHLVRVELPTWTLYDRGAGLASKRAASSWVTGRAPWTEATSNRYYQAGGNGVAMRVLPHCIYHMNSETFDPISRSIFLDGVTTHGHPNALVGAACFGYALWSSIRRMDKLQYGALIEDVLDHRHIWGQLPTIHEIDDSWLARADRSLSIPYSKEWDVSVDQMMELLRIGLSAIREGALARDLEVLEALYCFDRKINGSGNVAAACALFLGSRHAVDPLSGLTLTARLKGADTDTLASMVGSLLAAIAGRDWFDSLAKLVQDAQYIESIAVKLASGGSSPATLIKNVGRSEVEAFKRGISDKRFDDSIVFPDGREGKVRAIDELKSASNTNVTKAWFVELVDGQTVYVTKSTRAKGDPVVVTGAVRDPQPHPTHNQSEVGVSRVAVRLNVRDLARAKAFYCDVLGVPIQKESTNYVNLVNSLILVQRPHPDASSIGARAITIVIRVQSLEAVIQRMQAHTGAKAEQYAYQGDQRFVFCLDPDGHRVEIVESL